MKRGLLSVLLFFAARGTLCGAEVGIPFAVGPFTRIDMRGPGKLRIIQGESDSVIACAQRPVQMGMRAVVENGVLRLWKEPFPPVFNENSTISWIVTVRDLEALSVTGLARVEADNLELTSFRLIADGNAKITLGSLSAKELAIESRGGALIETGLLKVNDVDCRISGAGVLRMPAIDVQNIQTELNGAGKIFLRGRSDKSSVTMRGAARYEAPDLRCGRVVLDMAGSSKASVHPLDDLVINGSGMNTVRYRGEPRISQQTSGITEIVKID